MFQLGKVALAVCLFLLAHSANAAPQVVAIVTNKGVRLDALGGGSAICTVSVRYSYFRAGSRKTDVLECVGMATPLTAGPICAQLLKGATDIRIESPVTTLCS